MATTDLHCDDDEFGDDAKFGGEGRIDGWVAEAEADGAVSTYDLEEHSEHSESLLIIWVAAVT